MWLRAIALAFAAAHVGGKTINTFNSTIQKEVSMSTQVPDTTAATPSTSAAPASTATTAPATTTTKKPASLKAVTGFGKLDSNALANMAHHIAKGVGGNPVYFPNPPIDPAALDASAKTLSEAVLAAMEGGKTAKAVVQKQRKLIIQDLNLLAVFVQNASNDDPVIFAASGFTAKPTGKSAPQPVAVPFVPFLGFRHEFRPGRCRSQRGSRRKVVLHPSCGNERNDSRPVDDGSGSHDPKAHHHLWPDAHHDVRVSGTGSRRARLLRLEHDRNDRSPIARSSLKGIGPMQIGSIPLFSHY
jgi:hypothetical protein